MQLPPNVNLADLQKYIDDEIEKQRMAEHAEKRAFIDKLLEEREATMAATAKADAEKRAAGDPNVRAAELLFRVLGEAGEWTKFMSHMAHANMAKLAREISRIESERSTGAKHRAAVEATSTRVDAAAHAAAVRKARIESELAAAGVAIDNVPEAVAA